MKAVKLTSMVTAQGHCEAYLQEQRARHIERKQYGKRKPVPIKTITIVTRRNNQIINRKDIAYA